MKFQLPSERKEQAEEKKVIYMKTHPAYVRRETERIKREISDKAKQ